MNIFFLSYDPWGCSKQHNDKHCVKMILEYAQLMSTAHRVLDGTPYKVKSNKGMTVTRYKLDDDREHILYKACHVNHPSAVWVRQSMNHYDWLYQLFFNLSLEYESRYDKTHMTFLKLKDTLVYTPKNISRVCGWSDPPLCMPDKYKTNNVVESYRNYYIGDKSSFSTWKSPAKMPNWFQQGVTNANL